MARARRILIIDGHPDADRLRYIHALADRYAKGARAAGHEVRVIDLAALRFTSLQGNQEFLTGTPSPAIRQCQADLEWADGLLALRRLEGEQLEAQGTLPLALKPGRGWVAGPLEARLHLSPYPLARLNSLFGTALDGLMEARGVVRWYA